MRSAFAYTPRPGPLQSASAGAAITYLGAFVFAAFLFENPLVIAAAGSGAALAGFLAGARGAVIAGIKMGLTLTVLITLVNGLVTDRGVTVLLRLGHWPLLGEVNVTGEALAAGAAIGLRAMATMVAFAVYSACVDPDRVMRLLRPVAGRSALTAALISRLVPVAAADASRLREASTLRGPGAAPLGRASLVRRLLAGSLDRAVDVAATLELRGYGLQRRPAERRSDRSRHDRRFLLAGVVLAGAALVVKFLGADGYASYPALEIASGAGIFGLVALLVAAGAVPFRRGRRDRARVTEPAHA